MAFASCPHEPGATGIQKECPCKRFPLFFSVLTASQYGDFEGVIRAIAVVYRFSLDLCAMVDISNNL
jgi:hypothetical protein